MKKVLVFLISLILIPTMTYAITEEEVSSKIDKVKNDYLTENNGKYNLNVNYINPDIMLEHLDGACQYSDSEYEIYVKDFEANYPNEQAQSKEEWLKESIKECKNEYYYNLFESYVKKYIKLDGLSFTLQEKNIAILKYEGDGTQQGLPTLEVTINYKSEYDEAEISQAFSKINLFQNYYEINSLLYFNLIFNTDYEFPEDLLYYDQNIKKILEKFDMSEIQFIGVGAGGINGSEGSDYFITYTKNNTIYAAKKISVMAKKYLYLDKDESGTISEKIQKRLKDYFNSKVEISDIKVEEKNEDEIIPVTMNFNGKEISFVAIEVTKEELDKGLVESFDKDSGINVQTTSYDVPLNAKVKGQDVTNNQHVIDALKKNNLNVDLAFDITLSTYSSETIINKIERGIEVYIPVDESYTIGSKHKIYYIKDDASIGETLEGTIVSLNNKKYIKFTTYHFSTYALATEIISSNNSSSNVTTNDNSSNNNQSNSTQEKQEEVPNTLDNMGISLIINLVSSISIILLIKILLLKKENNHV